MATLLSFQMSVVARLEERIALLELHLEASRLQGSTDFAEQAELRVVLRGIPGKEDEAGSITDIILPALRELRYSPQAQQALAAQLLKQGNIPPDSLGELKRMASPQ